MLDRERLDDRLEKCILGLITLVLILAPLMFGSARLRDELVLMGLTVVTLGVWLVRLWIRSEYRILWPPFAWAVVAFVAYAIWRYSSADVEYIARLEINRIILYTAIFFLILDNLNRQEWTQFLVFVLIGVGTVMSMYAIFQYLTGSHKVYNTPQAPMYYGRAGGPFVCPNHLAGYLGMALPLAFSMTLMARFKPVTKVFAGYAAIVMLCGLVTTVSRGGIAAAVLGLFFLVSVLVFKRDTRLPAIVAIVLTLIPAVWLGLKSFRLQARFQKGTEGAAENFAGDRTYLYRAAVGMWRENFWTGVGPAHFDERFRPYRGELAQLQGSPKWTHNDYLNTLADYGLIGFALIAGAWGIFWISALRIWRYVRRANDFGSKQSTRAGIVLGSSAGLIAMLAHVFVDFDIHITGLAIVVVTLLAIVTGHWRFATERFWVRPGIIGRSLVSLICLAAMCWLTIQLQRLWPEQQLLGQVRNRERLSESDFARLQKAFSVEPQNPETPYLIGEYLRKQSWLGEPGYEKKAQDAIAWFDKAIALNKFDPHGFLGKGLCLDWLGKTDEAWENFRHAIVLDPNSYLTRAYYGWHFYQLRDYLKARHWFQQSLNVRPDNPIAKPYMELIFRRIQEQNDAKAKGTPKITEPGLERAR